MSEKLKIIVADSHQQVCNHLIKIIKSGKINLEVIGIANEGERLLSIIDHTRPDIVISSIKLQAMDGFEVIRQARSKAVNCRFILTGSEKSYEHIYEALRLKVDDYLLKPLDEDIVCESLERITKEIYQDITDARNREKSKEYLDFYGNLERLWNYPIQLTKVNKLYGTNFRNGFFSMLHFKLDSVNHDISFIDAVQSIQELSQKKFSTFCSDIIFSEKSDGLMIILNYAFEYERHYHKIIYEIYSEIKKSIDPSKKINITLCVSSSVLEPSMVWHLREQVRSIEWARIALGMNRIINYEEIENQNVSQYQPRLDELSEKIKKSFEALDTESFKNNVEQFFSLPMHVLYSNEARVFLRQHVYIFFQICKDYVRQNVTEYDFLLGVVATFHDCTSFNQIKEIYISKITALMDEFKEIKNNQIPENIRNAFAYIAKNYDKPISLEDVASEMGLSRVYFSSLFKKQTGKKFTEYILEYRMKKACELIKDSDVSITKIANSLSFTDVRYFSKLFKKVVGITPTECRKLYRVK